MENADIFLGLLAFWALCLGIRRVILSGRRAKAWEQAMQRRMRQEQKGPNSGDAA